MFYYENENVDMNCSCIATFFHSPIILLFLSENNGVPLFHCEINVGLWSTSCITDYGHISFSIIANHLVNDSNTFLFHFFFDISISNMYFDPNQLTSEENENVDMNCSCLATSSHCPIIPLSHCFIVRTMVACNPLLVLLIVAIFRVQS